MFGGSFPKRNRVASFLCVWGNAKRPLTNGMDIGLNTLNLKYFRQLHWPACIMRR